VHDEEEATMSTAPLDYTTYTTILAQATTLVRKSTPGVTLFDTLRGLALAYSDDPRYGAAAERYGRQLARPRRAGHTAAPVPIVKTDPATGDTPSPAYQHLMAYAQTKLDLGEVRDILEGLAQVAAEHPDLRQHYEAAQLACLAGQVRPTADEADTQKETDMDPAQDALTKGAPADPASATTTLLTRIAKRQQEKPQLSYEQASLQVFRADPLLHRAYVHEQRYPQPQGRPVEKRAPLAPEAIEKMVDEAQRPQMSRMAAWQEVLTSHEGRPDFGTVYEQYRKYQTSPAALRAHDADVLAKTRAGK
jgi:hypothetical protein